MLNHLSRVGLPRPVVLGNYIVFNYTLATMKISAGGIYLSVMRSCDQTSSLPALLYNNAFLNMNIFKHSLCLFLSAFYMFRHLVLKTTHILLFMC